MHISRGGQPLARSPISVTISQAELGDASRVRVAGPGLREGRTFEPAHFTIDTRDAGTSPSPGNWARGGVPGAGVPADGPLPRLRGAESLHRGAQQGGHHHGGAGGRDLPRLLLPHRTRQLHHLRQIRRPARPRWVPRWELGGLEALPGLGGDRGKWWHWEGVSGSTGRVYWGNLGYWEHGGRVLGGIWGGSWGTEWGVGVQWDQEKTGGV